MDSGKDGSVVPIPHEPDCFCNNDASKDDVHVMGCCGKKVHVLCLVGYIHSIPFCMYCSASLNVSYKTLPEQAISLPMSQQSPADEAESVIESSIIINNKAKEASMLKEASMSNDALAAIPLCQEIATMTNDASGAAEEEGGNERNSSSSPLKEDILRTEGRDKKRKMQAISAEKEMKRRGECLVAEGLGVGAVLTLKVDYRTHSHAEGLVVIVYKSNEYGSALVCCESGVITHDGSKGDYWVPSDKFVVNAGVGELAAIPKSLQTVRDAVVNGTYDYEKQPRMSYSKYHAEVTGATSPCKRAVCSCSKGVCGNRCGCRRKKLQCTRVLVDSVETAT